jgi:diguanylate cyclase
MEEELLDFAEETEPQKEPPHRSWRVLIVDDEPDVHASTKLAVSDVVILGRSLEFLHAHSAREGREVLARESDIAVILLDVVMEETDSGLKLVEIIRRDLGLKEVRIILRTGQPGYAPESDAVRDFDINDYKTKSDLTRNKLYASLTSAIRSYQQIHAINASRRGLELILAASGRLMGLQGLHEFAVGVITQLAALVQVSPEGLVCAQTRQHDDDAWHPRIVAAAGHYRDLINQPLTSLGEAPIRQELESCLSERHSIFGTRSTVLFFGGSDGQDMAVYLDLTEPLDEVYEHLIEVFCNSISACLENVRHFHRMNAAAYQDPVCELPNRVALMDMMYASQCVERVDTRALVLLSIDHLTESSHAFGYGYSDARLVVFAQRLADAFGSHAVVARVCSDTFALLGQADALEQAAIDSVVNAPLTVAGVASEIHVYQGLVMLRDVMDDSGLCSGRDALHVAEQALHAARHKGQRVGHASVELRLKNEARVQLLTELRDAVVAGAVCVSFVPDASAKTHTAQLQWKRATGECVPAHEIVSLAELSGLIHPLGELLLRAACDEAKRNGDSGSDARIALTLSPVLWRSPGFIAMIDTALQRSGGDPTRLSVNLAQSLAVHGDDAMRAVQAQLHARGVAAAA